MERDGGRGEEELTTENAKKINDLLKKSLRLCVFAVKKSLRGLRFSL
jgi:hypothetical protein